GRDLQSVPVQFERAKNLRAQQRADVGAVRVDPVLVQVAADGGSADVVVLLQAEDVEARLRQEGRGGEPVVAGPDDDGVIRFHRLSKPPNKKVASRAGRRPSRCRGASLGTKSSSGGLAAAACIDSLDRHYAV